MDEAEIERIEIRLRRASMALPAQITPDHPIINDVRDALAAGMPPEQVARAIGRTRRTVDRWTK